MSLLLHGEVTDRHVDIFDREAATSGNPKFFLGTDSATHAVGDKETACGCAGIFNAPVALEFYATVFYEQGGKKVFHMNTGILPSGARVKPIQCYAILFLRVVGMFAVESYAAVRRFVFVESHSRREVSRAFGLSRETVSNKANLRKAARLCPKNLTPSRAREI